MDEENHLHFLDRFAGLEPQREAITLIFDEWQKIANELRQVMKRREQLHNERELLLFQKNEIERANIRVGEEEELLNERRILDSVRSLMESTTTIEQILDSEEVSVANLLSQAQKELDSMAAVDTTLQKQQELLTEIGYQVEELRRFIQQYGAGLQDDPHRLEEINLRLDEIYQLKKKYGGSEEAVLKTLEEISGRLKNRPDTDQLIADLQKQEQALGERYAKDALTLSDARADAAKSLSRLVMTQSKKLAIADCKFQCEFLYEEDADGIPHNGRPVKPLPHGLENGRFLFAANPGSPPRSLVKTASGGEMSRVLLALKSAERETGRLAHSLLVFDEVDAGIGGRTAIEVGKKLKELAADCQVLVITHLHQIARQADQHLVAEKTTDRKKKTVITVRPLKKSEIPQELERMVALPQTEPA
jgi:DNA repair protein RecN (Recombination protein N)